MSNKPEDIDEIKDLWQEFGRFPTICGQCMGTVWSDKEFANLDLHESPSDILPIMSEGTVVYIDNKEHDRHLQPANIVGRDHLHYRLQFWDGCIWMPYHWVQPLPEDMIVFNDQ